MNEHYSMVLYMIVVGVVLGYFLMPILIDTNKTINLNKVYQAFLMGSTMGLAMVLVLDVPRRAKLIWIVALGGVSALLIVMIRKQSFVYERQFTKSMIEHHQMAVAMSTAILEKTHKDPFICRLAKQIIVSQEKEISAMKSWLVDPNILNHETAQCT